MMNIDACGLSCPQPVLLTMKAIKDNPSDLIVLVDTNVACENVQRLAQTRGYSVEIEQTGETFKLNLTK